MAVRLDAAVRKEVARIDGIMRDLTSNSQWLAHFGMGMSEREVNLGLVKFSETLRGAHLRANEEFDPKYAGVSDIFVRCDSLEQRCNNIEAIEERINENQKKIRTDAEEGIFYEPALTDFDPIRYRVLKKPLGKWQGLLPTKTVPPGAQETKYTMWESTGETDRSAPGAMTGVPYVGVKNERFTNPIHSAKLGYMLTTADQRAAAFANEPLLDELLIASQQAVAKKLDVTAWLGDATLGIDGALNQTPVPTFQASLDGGTRSWSNLNKSNDAVFKDWNDGIAQIAINSQENWTPEDYAFRAIMDRGTKQAINRRMATGTDTTLLNFIRNNTDINIVDIRVIKDIAGSGPAGSNQVFIYPVDDRVFRYRVNQDILWAPMQWDDLTMKFPGEIIHGYCEFIYPVACIYIYDV